MSRKLTVDIPLNRVEGDLEIRAIVEDGQCLEAQCSGTMFRGFERLLVGRGSLDGLVITPRICGICSMSHLTAAVLALDDLAGANPPPDAVRLRNLTQMVEQIQSDVHHSVLMFAADFVNPAHRDQLLYGEAQRRYRAFEGTSFVEVVRETKKILELVAIIGGQWPHSTFMVPGGVTSLTSSADLQQCGILLKRFKRWYEDRILGCTIDRWLKISNRQELESWLEEKVEHRESEVGFLLDYGRAIGLDTIGAGNGVFLSYGGLDIPQDTKVQGRRATAQLIPSGVLFQGVLEEFSQDLVTEHVARSWFVDSGGGTHPMESTTEPFASGREGNAYSWGKAPRYKGRPAETGPLADAMVSGHPLFRELVGRGGGSALYRQLARLVRAADLIPAMEAWIEETRPTEGSFYNPPPVMEDGAGVGLTQAPRGALGHWVQIKDGCISHYQIIAPTTWNASPRDTDGVPGPIETALQGMTIEDPENPIALGHVIRSFDPCLVCTVHTVSKPGQMVGDTDKVAAR